MNRGSFAMYIEYFLAPTLNKGDVVILDNLSSHKSPKTAQILRACPIKSRAISVGCDSFGFAEASKAFTMTWIEAAHGTASANRPVMQAT